MPTELTVALIASAPSIITALAALVWAIRRDPRAPSPPPDGERL